MQGPKISASNKIKIATNKVIKVVINGEELNQVSNQLLILLSLFPLASTSLTLAMESLTTL
jgi:adenylyl- and sulfurtransferase ThiI